MFKVQYTGPRAILTRLGLVCEEFEEAHGKSPQPFANCIDILCLPLNDQTGFDVTTFEGREVLERLPAQYEEFTKGEIVPIV